MMLTWKVQGPELNFWYKKERKEERKEESVPDYVLYYVKFLYADLLYVS